MRYCYVEDNKIVRGPILLPKTWNNITNFHLLDQETVRLYGWLPHTFIETATEDQIIEGSTFEIFPDRVVETQISRDPTEEEARQRTEHRWKMLRAQRNYALSLSDWSQMPDNGLDEQKKSEWVVYRQQLRDLPSTVTVPTGATFPTDPNGFRLEPAKIPPSDLSKYYDMA